MSSHAKTMSLVRLIQREFREAYELKEPSHRFRIDTPPRKTRRRVWTREKGIIEEEGHTDAIELVRQAIPDLEVIQGLGTVTIEIEEEGEDEELAEDYDISVTKELVDDVDKLNDQFSEILRQKKLHWISKMELALRFIGKIPRAAEIEISRETRREEGLRDEWKEFAKTYKQLQADFMQEFASKPKRLPGGGITAPPRGWNDFEARVRNCFFDLTMLIAKFRAIEKGLSKSREFTEKAALKLEQRKTPYHAGHLAKEDAAISFATEEAPPLFVATKEKEKGEERG